MTIERHNTEPYDHTAPLLSALVPCHYDFIMKCTKAKLIDHIVTTSGLHLYRASVAADVRRLKAESLRRRGRKCAAPRLQIIREHAV